MVRHVVKNIIMSIIAVSLRGTYTEFIPEPCLVFFPHLEHYDIIGNQSLGLYRMKTLCLVFSFTMWWPLFVPFAFETFKR